MACYQFATYTARSGGRRNGTLELTKYTDVVSVAYGVDGAPTNTFVMEICLTNGQTYLVRYLRGPDYEEGEPEAGNDAFLSLWCGDQQQQV